MTTDINSIRNNLLDFIVKREYEVNRDKLKDIGSDKNKDLLLYFYLKLRDKEGYILSSKQKNALDILNSLYKDDKYNNILLSDFYTSFKTIYDIAKNYKETDNDVESKKIEDIANNFKKLYLLYNKDVYDDLKDEKKETVFKYIKKNINKFKGGDNENNYKKFVSKYILKDGDGNGDGDGDGDNILNKYSIFNLDKKTIEKNEENKKEKEIYIKKNINYNILLRQLLFSNKKIKVVPATVPGAPAVAGETVSTAAVEESPVSTAAGTTGTVAGAPEATAGAPAATAGTAGRSISSVNNAAGWGISYIGRRVPVVPAGAPAVVPAVPAAGWGISYIGRRVPVVPAGAPAVVPVVPAGAPAVSPAAFNAGWGDTRSVSRVSGPSNNGAIILGGADTDIIKKDIIEILNEYKDELLYIDTKTCNITSYIISNITSNITSNIDRYNTNNSNINYEKDFNDYEKKIDDLKDNKNVLEEYFKKINTIYNDINISIKGIDTEILKDILLKKHIKEFNKFSLNDIDINIKIKEYNKLINQYPKNKEKYDKYLQKEEEEKKHERAVKLETAKAEGIKAMLNKGSSYIGGTDDKQEKKLKDLINILEKIINILRTKIPSSNNDDNNTTNIDIDSSLFEKIWSQYVKYANDVKLELKGNRTLMDAEDNFYDQINMNDLNPVDVLEINSKDKYIFCALIFFIRLFIVVIINLLIEYNVIKRLDTALIIYILAYVLIIIIIAIVVNLDTYKLRILLNYFNMNMNINLLILHIFIVVIFFILILIIIFDNENNKYRNNFNSIFDFSYIYFILWHLFRGRINDEDVKNAIINDNISTNDKLKIQYKFEILTMIVYIFSSAIVLII